MHGQMQLSDDLVSSNIVVVTAVGTGKGVAYIFFSGMPATGWSGVSWSTETNPLAAPSDPEARAVSMAVGTAHQRARHRLAGGSPARAVPLRAGCSR